MLFDNEKPSTANTPSIRNRRNIQPPSPKGAMPAGYWVSKK
jgi:hypothetical protein